VKDKRQETEAERLARYAQRDVTDKLGLKEHQAVHVAGKGDPALLEKVSVRVNRRFVRAGERADIVLYWPRAAAEIVPTLNVLKGALQPAGGIWVITAKKGGEPYVPDRVLIPLGLASGLVDNKICSVSDTHSAMRFVIRRTDREKL
jgi:Protein of unknown function (DUF3052)